MKKFIKIDIDFFVAWLTECDEHNSACYIKGKKQKYQVERKTTENRKNIKSGIKMKYMIYR